MDDKKRVAMTDTLYEPITKPIDPVKLYLDKVIELRRAFEKYSAIQAELDAAWHRLSDDTQTRLAHMSHDEYKAIRDSYGVADY